MDPAGPCWARDMLKTSEHEIQLQVKNVAVERRPVHGADPCMDAFKAWLSLQIDAPSPIGACDDSDLVLPGFI